MSKMVIIVGASGTGKTTLQKNLENGGYKRIVTYTTRPPREGEQDGVDYHFIDDISFEDMVESDRFAEYTCYNTAFAGLVTYGSRKDDYIYREADSVVVLNPEGLMSVLSNMPKLNPIVLYLTTVDDNLLLERIRARGDSEEEIQRRFKADKKDFRELEKFLSSDISGSQFTLITMEIKGLDEIPLYLHAKEGIDGLS